MSLSTALTGTAGQQIVVKATTMDGYGFPSTSSVVWTTSDATVATVQNTVDLVGGALITCVATGTCTITATAGSINATFTLTVISNTPGVAATIDVNADYTLQPSKKTQ